ncbi:MAG: CRISPR-associated endonuclease Cas1 [Pseudomonadota bacterium]|nr:CRISPR-associated endonuclease Cas1 [Pseudomonadota bacterium]
MTTLYLDRRDLSLRLEGRALVLYADGQRQGTVPLHLLERVVMRSAVQIESSLLARLADAGIGVLVFGGRNASKLATVQGRAHNDGARRIGQYRRYDDAGWRRQWSRRLVLGKLKGQALLLRSAVEERPDLRLPLREALAQIEQARTRVTASEILAVGTLRGMEGAAAAAYFKGFTLLFPASLEFKGRNRRPPRDPVNSVLSLGYTLLHFEAVRACYTAGLDPIIGYFHELDFGRESLAADLIEPLRPRIDAWAWEQFRNRHLREEQFNRDGDACLLGKAGRQHFFGGFEALARPLRRLLRRFAGKLAATLAAAGKTASLSRENPV